MQLSKSEETVMEIIWKHEKVFMKEIIESFKEPKPATTTLATLLKRMQEKGAVGYELFGNSRQYHALVKKEDYFSKHVKNLVKDFFGNSTLQFASFFTSNGHMTTQELEDLKKIVNNQIEIQKNKKW